MGGRKDDTERRASLRHDLTREVRRLMQHIRHLSVEELTTLEGITEDLEQIHTDDEKCVTLSRRHGDRSPPWGTRYASAIERAYHAVREAFRGG